MDPKRLVRISKYLSKHLRHQPERLGLTLEPGGWVEIEALLSAAAKNNFPITHEELEEVVRQNDKKRFSIDPTGEKIRANQGHSVEVDLQLDPKTPPDFLYHGTARKTLEGILERGILRMSRHHVHLSKDQETARKVGMRHGKPVILEINAAAMHKDGHVFYCSDNGVWLVESVPPQYIRAL